EQIPNWYQIHTALFIVSTVRTEMLETAIHQVLNWILQYQNIILEKGLTPTPALGVRLCVCVYVCVYVYAMCVYLCLCVCVCVCVYEMCVCVCVCVSPEAE